MALMSNRLFQTAKYGYVLISALLCAAGTMLVMDPDYSLSFLCRISGILLIVFGVVKILGYCSGDLYCLVFQHDLAGGILMIALGVILIVRSGIMSNVICMCMGIYILMDALLKIQVSIDARKFGILKWWLIFAAAVITGVVGFLLVLRPSESAAVLLRILGISFLMEGILNLVTILTAARFVRNRVNPVIEGEYRESDPDEVL